MTTTKVLVVDDHPLARRGIATHARRAADYRQFRSVKALAPLLGYLRGLAVLTDAAPQSANTTSAVLLQRFRAYLLDERALGAASARGYVDLVAAFVEECVRDGGDLRG